MSNTLGSLCKKIFWIIQTVLKTWFRGVASLTVPGGQEFHFPHFASNFYWLFLSFLKFSSSFWPPRVGDSPTREGPGYATDVVLNMDTHKTQEFRTFDGCYCFCKIPRDGGLLPNIVQCIEGSWIWTSDGECFITILFKSYYNLYFIKDPLVILIFATPAGGHKCIKEYLLLQNQQHSAKVLNSEFCLCPR